MRSAPSDLGLHCLPVTRLGVPSLHLVRHTADGFVEITGLFGLLNLYFKPDKSPIFWKVSSICCLLHVYIYVHM